MAITGSSTSGATVADASYRHALRRRPLFTPLYAMVAFALVAVAVLGWAAIGLWQQPTTVIVVRHMDKLDGDDPALSATGAARADRLAEAFASARLDAIYSSGYRRADQTAEPLARRLSMPVQRYDASDSTALVRRIMREHRAGTVLVVGHSNTVPDIVRGLSKRTVGEIAEDRYGDVFIVTLPRWGRSAVTRLYLSAPE